MNNDLGEILLTSTYPKQKKFWINKLKNISKTSLNEFVIEHNESEVSIIDLQLNANLSKSIISLCKDSDLLIYVTLLAGLKALINQYTNKTDISIISPIYKPLISKSTLNNQVLINNDVNGDSSFKGILKQIKDTVAEAYENQDYPFDKIINLNDIKSGVTDILCLFSSIHEEKIFEKFDSGLAFNFYKNKDVICLKVKYLSGDYNHIFLNKFISHLFGFLENALEKMDQSINTIEYLSESEKEQLLFEFNDTKAECTKDQRVHQIFEKQVSLTPERIALKLGADTLTYRELNAKANCVAKKLRLLGVGRDDIVSILLDRSFNTIISMLGVLKSGGAYLPIDPDYPDERINFILKDSNTVLVISTKKYSEKINFNIGVIEIDEEGFFVNEKENLINVNKSNDLCYVIYTSGTTGNPKGVMVEHSNVVSLFFNDKFQFSFSEKDIWTMFHSPCFDFSVWEMYGAILFGGKLVIIPKLIAKDVHAYVDIISEEKVTVLNQTPSVFYNLSEIVLNSAIKRLDSLRYIIFGGESLKPVKLKDWYNEYKNVNLINMYGITETTVHVTYKEIKEYEIENNLNNIGSPIPTLTAYVFNEKQKLVPIGVAGELLVGGAGVSRGYLGNTQLTSDKFIYNPYKPKEKLYRSGDLVKMMQNGEMEYIGRIDHQVQLRGFRIELGEIESALLKLTAIKSAVVIDREDELADKFLCAYYVVNTEVSKKEIREYLESSLPEYMVPSYFIELDKIPLTSNGKVDHKILPLPKLDLDCYVAPENDMQEKLVRIWSEILNLPQENIGITDNFFAIGGHSLRAAVLKGKISKELEVEISLPYLFENPTIKSLALKIQSLENKKYLEIDSREKKEYYPLSSAQKRMYFLYEFDKESIRYNLNEAIRLKGNIDTDKLQLIFNKLIERHESLRTFYISVDNIPCQKIVDKIDFKIDFINNGESDKNQIQGFIRPFKLDELPLFRVGLIKESKDEHILLVDMHHIITDGISLEILIKDFTTLYNDQYLPQLRLQYKDFSEWQQSNEQQLNIKKQKDYLLNVFSGELPVLELQNDYKRPLIRTNSGDREVFSIDEDISRAINEMALAEGVSLYMFLLSVFNIFLSKISNQEDIIVGCGTAGRNHNDLDSIIGMFINIVAHRNFPKGALTFKDFLENVKVRSLNAFENQDYQYEELINDLKLTRDTSRNALFDHVFELVNIETSDFDLPDLKLSSFDHDTNTSKFDLVLYASESNEKINFTFEYYTGIFKKETILKFIEYYKIILNEVVKNKDIKISEINILNKEETENLALKLNNIDADYPKNINIHEIFENQVKNNSDKSALIFENKEITYEELNNRSNQLAAYLREKGVEPDSIVALLIDRSIETIVGILGILKAGGAYLPIDSEYPEDRIKFILNDSGAKFLISKSDIVESFSFSSLLNLDEDLCIACKNQGREPIKELDSMPFPDRSLIDFEKYNQFIGLAMVKNAVSIQASRGCPYKCLYCHKIWPKSHYIRSAENIFEEVKMYYDMGVRRFAMIDDIFNLRKKNSERFFRLIIENKLEVQFLFPNGVRGDILTPEYIDLMVEAGTINIALALETASPRLQKLIKKNINLPRLRENMEYIATKHPHVLLDIFTMHGFPSETKEEAMLTFEFIKSIKWLHFPYFHILKVYPNTDMAELAMENGISAEFIAESVSLAYHELPQTLPFDHNFTKGMQAELLEDYILNKERLLYVLPFQLKVLTKDELAQKYDSYLPVEIRNYEELLEYLNISESELSGIDFVDERKYDIINFNEKLTNKFGVHKSKPKALKVLLLDLSQYFSDAENMLYDVVEPPLGLIYLLTNLYKEIGEDVTGKIAKSRIDFDNFEELKDLLTEFQPDVIGIRTLSFYKDFFHLSIQKIRDWGFNVPIIAGGPYASSDYNIILKDPNVDLVVFGEGELTFVELIKAIIANNKNLPKIDELKTIQGLILPDKSQLESIQLVLLDDDNENINNKPETNLKNINKPNDLCYIIYTSGTTGNPKGVMIEHQNLVRLMFNDKIQFTFSENDVWTMFHNHCFDFSVWEMYGALLYGGKLVIIPPMVAREPSEFIKIIKEHKVTVLNQTPSAFYNLIEEGLENKNLKFNLRYLIFGGEALKPIKLNDWYKENLDTKIVNMFGITETTVHVTYKEIGIYEIENNISNIGKPIPTLSMYLIGRDGQLVPKGVRGEIYVGGKGVARGYLNKDQLSKEKFVYLPEISERLYRSGDLGRMLDNGEIEYLGRIDNQIQLRGFRVEIGEIESQILKYSQVSDVVLLEKEDKEGNSSLHAFIVGGENLDISKLRSFLAGKLPFYMIPSYLYKIEEIPLTSNGKVDRKKLLEIDYSEGSSCEGPRNEVERIIIDIYTEVLGVTNIGLKTNFFNSGGDSIKAIGLINKINVEFKCKIKIPDLYQNDTIEKFAHFITQNINIDEFDEDEGNVKRYLEKLKEEVYTSGIANPKEVEDVFPMADVQKGMVFHSIRDEEFAIFHDQIVNIVKFQDLDVDLLYKALSLMSMKHPILRTSFYLDYKGESLQFVYKDIKIDYEHLDIANSSPEEKEIYINECLLKDRKKRLDHESPGLWRLKTINLGDNDYCVCFICHHAIIDGWSDASFLTELNNIYFNLKNDINYIVKPLKSSYKDYVVDQLKRKGDSESEEFWKRYLTDYKKFTFKVAGGITDTTEESYSRMIDSSLTEKIIKISKKNNLDKKNIFLGAFVYALNLFSYQNDITIGLATNNRPLKEDAEKILGCFLNTVPFRATIQKKQTWIEYLKYINKQMIEILKFKELSISDISTLVEGAGKNKNSIFDVLYNYVDFHVYNEIKYDNEVSINKKSINEEGRSRDLDIKNGARNNSLLTFNLNGTGENYSCSLHYGISFISNEMVVELVNCFTATLELMVSNSNLLIDRDLILFQNNNNIIKSKFNNTKCDYPQNSSISQLFEEQVKRSSDKVALVDTRVSYTYKELDEESNKIANCLKKRNVERNQLIGLITDRSSDMIISILGIIKAGCAYVPIEKNYPEDRIKHLINDSEIKIILKNSNFEFSFEGVEIINFDGDEINKASGNFEAVKNSSKDLAYVMYTSGSTGKPKGVGIEHKNVIRLVKDSTFFPFSSKHKILLTGALVFDATTFEIWGAILNGGTLYVVDNDILTDANLLGNYINEHSITAIWLTSSLFNQLVDQDITMFRTLSYLLVGGDVLSYKHINKVKRRFKELVIINGYGPTENTTFSTTYIIEGDDNKNIPIGKPISNSTAYIMNCNNELLPINISGQLCVGGDGVGRGYINNPELTNEKFINNPCNKEELIYLTGDTAKWLPNGNIEFEGRIDNQIKIRGFRIELGEIEEVLLKHEKINECIVLSIGETSDKFLCAYIVCLEKCSNEDLRKYLNKKLPNYMVPSYFVSIDKFPLNVNGKIDREALPLPQHEVNNEYVAPSNEIEEKLILIWSDVLKIPVDQIGTKTNFFDIGGHSLNATVVLARISKEFNIKIPFTDLLEIPTIQNTAMIIFQFSKVECFDEEIEI
ncbi:MAG: amino acid adenylation domain-containing protein [Bacteroidales bacterium]|nr:amino acid adenylation domain-containing protein [Bacteroidales bacterium]